MEPPGVIAEFTGSYPEQHLSKTYFNIAIFFPIMSPKLLNSLKVFLTKLSFAFLISPFPLHDSPHPPGRRTSRRSQIIRAHVCVLSSCVGKGLAANDTMRTELCQMRTGLVFHN